MGLQANGFRDTSGVFQTFGATASNNAYPSALWMNYARTGAMRNITAGEGITSELVSIPSGNRHPNAWMMPQKAGALAARNTLDGSGTVSSANAWAVKLATAAVTGSGDLTAFGGLIVQLIAALTGSGTVTAANLQAFLAAVADLTGSGDITDAELLAFGELIAALTGTGTTSPTLTGTGELDADIVAYGSLTPEGIRDAVWNAILANFLTPGSTGAALSSAGSAGDPWITNLPGAYAPGSAGDIIGNLLADMGTRAVDGTYTNDELLRILAAVIAGKVSGAGTGTETFRGINDDKDRVVATVDSNGNRTAITLDGS